MPSLRSIMFVSIAVILLIAATKVSPLFADEQTVEPPSEERHASNNQDMRFFLIGPQGDKAPLAGYRLLLVLPGGDGSADFAPFVTNIFSQSLSDQYFIAQLVAPKWRDDDNRIVWPTAKARDPKAKFTTEEFIDAVVDDVKKLHKIDEKHIFALGWSSSGPAVYAASLRTKTPITGAFVAMSVFHPDQIENIKAATGRAFYILHSPQDFIPMRFPQNAKDLLTKSGATVKLQTYEGGHGWHGDVFANIHNGVHWLEQNLANDKTK